MKLRSVVGKRNFAQLTLKRVLFKKKNSPQTIGEIGLKTKYFSSEYKKPLCIELEDVKISQSTESDLEADTQKSSKEVGCEKSLKRNDDDAARYIKRAQDYFTLSLDYILQFLPPTAMILLQVTFLALSTRLTFHHPKACKSSF